MTMTITEPRTYGPHSPWSYYRDLCTRAVGSGVSGYTEALERLERHAHEVAVEVQSGSAEGRRALALMRNEFRGEDKRAVLAREKEYRTGATSATVAGFTSPYWDIPQYALYRAAHRSFADQCMPVPLPPYGLEVHIPSFSSDVSVTQQASQNLAVAEVEPSGADLGASGTLPLVTLSGDVVVSLPMFERGGADGAGFDVIIGNQLHQKYNESLDKQVLAQALANATSVTPASTGNFIQKLYQDISSGREGLTDTAGVRVRATHIFSTSDMWCYLSEQVDTTNQRPIIVPMLLQGVQPPWMDGDKSKFARFTGYVHPGGMMWFEDDNIPASGANTQLIVSRPDTILLYEGDPIVAPFVQTHGETLSVILRMYGYVVAVPRFAKAHSTITGSNYALTEK